MAGDSTIETDYLVVGAGALGMTSTPQHLHVHCAASGLSDNPPRPIFSDDPATVRELQTCFFTALFPALDKLQVFAARATTRERARMFDPAASVGA